MTDAEAAKAGLEKVTDFVEDKGVDGARASEALSALATADDAAALSAGPLGRARPLSGGVRVALLLLLCAVSSFLFWEIG